MYIYKYIDKDEKIYIKIKRYKKVKKEFLYYNI